MLVTQQFWRERRDITSEVNIDDGAPACTARMSTASGRGRQVGPHAVDFAQAQRWTGGAKPGDPPNLRNNSSELYTDRG